MWKPKTEIRTPEKLETRKKVSKRQRKGDRKKKERDQDERMNATDLGEEPEKAGFVENLRVKLAR